ncbi:MAG: vWA domain-containing protein [Myxococcota bacterium]
MAGTLVAGLLAAACSSSNSPAILRLDPTSGDATGEGARAEFDDGGDFGDDGESDGLHGDDTCGELVYTPERQPLSIFFAVDKSTSMRDGGKWVDTRLAFLSFMSDRDADDINMALRFWPDEGCDESCNSQRCAEPQVEMGSLGDPDHEADLIDMFNAKQPSGLTPMEAALEGAERFALDYAAQVGSDEKVAVVFLTDGEPTVCSQDVDEIADYAEEAYARAGVLTFAVGLEGSNPAQVDKIAAAGATDAAYFLGGAGNTRQALLEALQSIRSTAVECTFSIPEGTAGRPTDPRLVNVRVTDGSGERSFLANVGERDACGEAAGWYYDNPENPMVIELCPASCESLKRGLLELDIAVGCETIVR